MEDTTFIDREMVRSNGDFVIRAFLPVRIERLLLTRLFDLATGRILAGTDDGTSVVTGSQTEPTHIGRKEAA